MPVNSSAILNAIINVERTRSFSFVPRGRKSEFLLGCAERSREIAQARRRFLETRLAIR